MNSNKLFHTCLLPATILAAIQPPPYLIYKCDLLIQDDYRCTCKELYPDDFFWTVPDKCIYIVWAGGTSGISIA